LSANPSPLARSGRVEHEHHVAAFEAEADAARAAEPGFTLSGALWIGVHGEIIGIDQAGTRLLGMGTRTWPGGWIVELELGLSSQDWNERVRRLGEGPLRFFTRITRADGAMIEIEVAASLREVGGKHYVIELVRDVRSERALRSAYEDLQARYDLVSQAANDGLWLWDLGNGEVEYSPRWASLMGLSEARLIGTIDMWLEHIHPADRPAVDEALGFHLDGLSEVFESEHRVEHRSGIWRWVLVRALAERNVDGNLVRVAGSTSDITHRKNAEERLRYEAFHDPLTGLANRAWLIHRLQDTLQQAHGFLTHRPEPQPPAGGVPRLTRDGREAPPADAGDQAAGDSDHFAIVLVGVDGFKLINDSFGPSLGDMLLRAVAARIARSVRSVDTVARIGGDEFALLLEGLESPDQVGVVADRIAKDLAQSFDLRGYAVYTSVSMGIVPATETYGEPEEVLRDANIALVRAKKGGRAKRVYFNQSMRTDTIRRLMLETDLRRALERAELRLAYQPIISLQTGEIQGFEALCRWHHNKHGLIGPAEFIPLAEESGQIVPIGRWALQTACEDALQWSGGVGCQHWVAVNVSGRQLSHPGYVDEVREVLLQTGLPPARLHLEITESVLMENAEASRDILASLRALGVELSIDDFGTGYSSLAYLRRFPIETLKIDRAFLAKDADAEDSWAIIETIRSLATILGIGVIVEGVETVEHALRLRKMGCQAAQGYIFARPIAAEDLDGYLERTGPKVIIENLR